jgi:hypothetical protein
MRFLIVGPLLIIGGWAWTGQLSDIKPQTIEYKRRDRLIARLLVASGIACLFIGLGSFLA